MEDIVSVIRSIVQEELKSHRTLELGVVTKLFSHESGSDKNNYACSVKLKDSELELQNVGISTQRIGAVAIPNKNDLVLVQFINGDVNNAVVIARVYNDADRPPEAKPHEFVYISPDSKESGIRRIYLEFPNENKFLLNDDEITLEAGTTKIKFNHGADIEIESNSKLLIKTKSDVSIDSSGKISLKSKGNIDLKADGDISLDGANIAIKAKSSASLEGGSMAKIKGSSITVSGNISFSP
jgi:hypothetical protein